MKSRMAWKPPPIFGGKKKCNHDHYSIAEKSIAEDLVLHKRATGVVARNNMIQGKTSIRRTGRQHSTAWKPPPVFVSHLSTNAAAEEEERKDQVFEEASSEDSEVFSPIDILCELIRDETLKTIGASNSDCPDGKDEEFVAIADEHQKRIQKNVVETFRPFRNDIARYVASRFRATKLDLSDREQRQNNSCANIDCVGVKENSTKILITATEDHYIDDKNTVPSLEAPRKSIADRELFAFWEGVRMAVHASIHVANVSRQQLPQTALSSFPSTLLPPHVAQTPRKYRSIRPTSTAHGSNASTRDHTVSPIEEKRDDSSTNEVTRQSVELSTITNRDSVHDETEKIKELLIELEEAEKYQCRLEKQLKKAGVVIAEDIPYDVAKQKVSEIALRMSELHDKSHGRSNSSKKQSDIEAEYFKLEQEMEKYITALELTDEWIKEQAEEERKWEESMEEDNKAALSMVLRHMPVDVKNRSEAKLIENPTPNGKFLPRSIAKKFKRTNCLQLLRTDPKKMIAWHPSMFENLSVSGLTLAERRALHQHLKPVGVYWKEGSTGVGDKMLERKLVWFETLKSNFRECRFAYERHIDMYGPPGNHPYAASSGDKGCPLIGKQCPLKADKAMDYSGDYGYPEESVYFDKTNDDNPDQSNGEVCGTCSKRTKAKEPTPKTRFHRPSPGRVGLLTDIKGHGFNGGLGLRGFSGMSQDTSRGRRCPGNGSLIDEIKHRGRKECSRGGLMNEIQSQSERLERLHPRPRGETHGGGRGALLAAIQARKSR